MGLQDTRVINERAEKISPAPRVDVVILRAVSDIKSCLDLAVRFLEKGSKVVLKKGPEENMAADPPHSNFSLIDEVGSPVTTVRNPACWCSKNAPFENVPRETFTNGFGLDDIVSRGTSLVEETSISLKKRKIWPFSFWVFTR